jgi:hypothetical protein
MLQEFCDWLSETPVSLTVQSVSWIIPTTQSIHILSIAVVMSCMVMFDLRMMRLVGRHHPIDVIGRRLLPPVWWALIALALTGTVLIVGEPARELTNVMFQLKVVLIFVAIVITAVMQNKMRLEPLYWEKRRMAAVFLATVSLLVWVGILSAGRWIGYVQHG